MSADIQTDPVGTATQESVPPCLSLQVAARLAQQLEARACRGAAVQPPLMGVLVMIHRHPGIRQGICADVLGFDATTFGRYVDRLVRGGLVERTVPVEDRRSIRLSVTEAGAAEAARCRDLERELEAEVRAKLGDAAWSELRSLLLRFLEGFDHPLPRLGPGGTVAGD